eukprot:TRINITY_DN3066_c2_g1_i1.p1 TRINITY_DN3066_c2_g1~~TRINITY_DN3066_c2_g1_i1.p1  ORF type:complete len:257 (+),score=4.81 TRINITY_DN3066_c2_g1_i1:201-971(+)
MRTQNVQEKKVVCGSHIIDPQQSPPSPTTLITMFTDTKTVMLYTDINNKKNTSPKYQLTYNHQTHTQIPRAIMIHNQQNKCKTIILRVQRPQPRPIPKQLNNKHYYHLLKNSLRQKSTKDVGRDKRKMFSICCTNNNYKTNLESHTESPELFIKKKKEEKKKRGNRDISTPPLVKNDMIKSYPTILTNLLTYFTQNYAYLTILTTFYSEQFPTQIPKYRKKKLPILYYYKLKNQVAFHYRPVHSYASAALKACTGV